MTNRKNSKGLIKLNKHGLVIIEDKELLSSITGAIQDSSKTEDGSHNGYCGHNLACSDKGCSSKQE